MHRLLPRIAPVLALLLCSAAARAQCGEWDNRFGTPLGMNGSVRAFTIWDPDGAGPLAAQLVAGGDFTTAGGVTVNGIARWDGSSWRPFGTGMNSSVRALTLWDPDGDGPLSPQLVAGGSFTTAGGVTVNGIARWDSSNWLPLGGGINLFGEVRALTLWDPDGDGPLSPQLVAGVPSPPPAT